MNLFQWPAAGILSVLRAASQEGYRPNQVIEANEIISDLVKSAPPLIRKMLMKSKSNKLKERVHESLAVNILMRGVRSAEQELIQQYFINLNELELEKIRGCLHEIMRNYFKLTPRERHLREFNLILKVLSTEWAEKYQPELEPKLGRLFCIIDDLMTDLQWAVPRMDNEQSGSSAFCENMAKLYHQVL